MLVIVKRAFGTYTKVEDFDGGWLDAELRAMALEYANHDGEYFVRKAGEEFHHNSAGNNACPVQAAFAYL